jgi:hypothetical protein
VLAPFPLTWTHFVGPRSFRAAQRPGASDVFRRVQVNACVGQLPGHRQAVLVSTVRRLRSQLPRGEGRRTASGRPRRFGVETDCSVVRWPVDGTRASAQASEAGFRLDGCGRERGLGLGPGGPLPRWSVSGISASVLRPRAGYQGGQQTDSVLRHRDRKRAAIGGLWTASALRCRDRKRTCSGGRWTEPLFRQRGRKQTV